MTCACNKLHVLSLGLALGVVWGLSVFLIGLLAMTGYGMELVKLLGSFYIGYAATIGGSLIGLVYGFFDGLIGGAIVAWLYNCFSAKTSKPCKCCKPESKTA